MLAGFRELMRAVADDAAIADRVRVKLRQFGRAPLAFGLPPGRVLVYLSGFWSTGSPRRAPAVVPRRPVARAGVRNPRLLPFAVLNWTYGLAIQAFVREHLKTTSAEPAAEIDAAVFYTRMPDRLTPQAGGRSGLPSMSGPLLVSLALLPRPPRPPTRRERGPRSFSPIRAADDAVLRWNEAALQAIKAAKTPRRSPPGTWRSCT